MSENDVVYKGVRWQRSQRGSLRWWNADSDKWVVYRRGRDAPPRPPVWEAQNQSANAKITLERPPWRSPYRVIPLLFLLGIIAIGAGQALRGSGGQVAAEGKAASALKGHCLARHGVGGSDGYGTTAVACTSHGPLVKVTEVLPGTPGSPSCPSGTTTVVLAYAGVPYPHQLCVVAVPGGS